MKKIFTLCAAMCTAMMVNAQVVTNLPGDVEKDALVVTDEQAQEGFELSTIAGLSVKACGATGWKSVPSDQDPYTVNGATYSKGYIQGNTNGMAGNLAHANGTSSHIQIVAEKDGVIWIGAKFGKNKQIWSAKCSAAYAEEELDYAVMTDLLTTYQGKYINVDGTYGADEAIAEADVYSALPLQIKAGEVNFFWVSGSKIMLTGFQWEEGATTAIANVAATSQNAAVYNLLGQRVAADTKGLVIINGKKVIRK